ncbi:MAG: DUF4339 domain-containing protein [Proteobacteria bacterium]|nr:DUF4339 domain-containing protein [Pseudomonadota bacterium]
MAGIESMKWFYESNGQPHGPIPEAELRRLRDADKISADSLVWQEGMPDWAPLNSVKALAQPFAAHTPELHPAPESRLPTLSPPSPGKAASLPTAPLQAFASGIHATLFHTQRTGEALQSPGDWKLPLAFLALAEVLGTLLMLTTVGLLPVANSKVAVLMRQMLGLQGGVGLTTLLLSSVLMLPLSMLAKSTVLHLCLKVFGRSQASFLTTFRTLCYAIGSSAVLWLIPLAAVASAGLAGETAVVDFAMAISMAVVAVWSMRVTILPGVFLRRRRLRRLISPA